jgi:hypothetical protein
MAIAILAERNSLATKYATDAPYGALFTADPGTSGTATGEVTGGSPAYARKALNWGTASASAVTSAATTIDVPSGANVQYFAVAARNIAAEVSSTADYSNRQKLVALVMQNPDFYALQFAIGIALDQNLTSTAGATDVQLYTGATDVWSAMAGMV